MSLDEIFQIEKHAEDALIAMLTTALPHAEGQPSNVYRSRQTRIAKTPRIEIKVVAGAPEKDHSYAFPSNPNIQMYDQYECELIVTVETNRTDDDTAPSHSALLGAVRARLQRIVALQTFESPVLFLIDLREQGTIDSEVSETNIDTSVLSWYFFVQIKPTAWPADPL